MKLVILLLCSVSIIPASSDRICGSGWIFSYGHCYIDGDQSASGYLKEAQEHCEMKDKDSYVMVINTMEEIVAGIENNVFGDSYYYTYGLQTDDNGTTWTRFDGSTEPTILETSKPWFDSTNGLGDHLECSLYLQSPPVCSFYDPFTSDVFLCEKNGPFIPEPCGKEFKHKLRRNSPRTIVMDNNERRACYFEIKGKAFKPAQLKIYGYHFSDKASDCETGFWIQGKGDPVEILNNKKLTCGDMPIPRRGRSLMKKKSGRNGFLRVYMAMNGDGNKVWMRVKARSLN